MDPDAVPTDRFLMLGTEPLANHFTNQAPHNANKKAPIYERTSQLQPRVEINLLAHQMWSTKGLNSPQHASLAHQTTPSSFHLPYKQLIFKNAGPNKSDLIHHRET
jgi:hypothetical protein